MAAQRRVVLCESTGRVPPCAASCCINHQVKGGCFPRNSQQWKVGRYTRRQLKGGINGLFELLADWLWNEWMNDTGELDSPLSGWIIWVLRRRARGAVVCMMSYIGWWGDNVQSTHSHRSVRIRGICAWSVNQSCSKKSQAARRLVATSPPKKKPVTALTCASASGYFAKHRRLVFFHTVPLNFDKFARVKKVPPSTRGDCLIWVPQCARNGWLDENREKNKYAGIGALGRKLLYRLTDGPHAHVTYRPRRNRGTGYSTFERLIV